MKRTISGLADVLQVWVKDLPFLLKGAGWWPRSGFKNWIILQWLTIRIVFKKD